MSSIESRTVVWHPTHEYAAGLAAQLGVDLTRRLPYPGTSAWLELEPSDPVKKAAMLLAASHQVLRLETEQVDRAEASRAIAGAADWSQIAREVQQRSLFREEHPWSKRVSV